MQHGLDETEEKDKSYVEGKEYKAATQRTKRRKQFFDESSTADSDCTELYSSLIIVSAPLTIVFLCLQLLCQVMRKVCCSDTCR